MFCPLLHPQTREDSIFLYLAVIECYTTLQQLKMFSQLGNANNKPYHITIYQFIFDILRRDNIPLDNIKTVVNSACSRYVRTNFFNNIFYR